MREISTFSSAKAGQLSAVEILSNATARYLDLTCTQRLFFVRFGRKVVISMPQNGCNLDMSFTDLSHETSDFRSLLRERTEVRHPIALAFPSAAPNGIYTIVWTEPTTIWTKSNRKKPETFFSGVCIDRREVT